jgi:hypothetical protein
MSRPGSLKERTEARTKGQEAQAERIRRIKAQQAANRARSEAAAPADAPPTAEPALAVIASPDMSWRRVKAGTGGLRYAARAEPTIALTMQPWTRGLVDDVLQAAADGCIRLCLVWPARLASAVPLHAMATLERALAKDMQGLRALLFPGTHTSAASIQGTLVDRTPLTDVYRQLWVTEAETISRRAATESDSFVAMLAALNDIRNWSSELPPPSLAETVPTFVFADGSWGTSVTKPLERSLRKVRKLAHRKKIRDEVNAEWGNLKVSPGALLVVHGTSRKDQWKAALQGCGTSGRARPEVLLLDATSAAARSNYHAVKRIPDFLRSAYDQGLAGTGVVIVTDDPKTFFILRAKLGEGRFSFSQRVYPAESEEVLLASNPLTADWKPAQKSNSNFSVGIVDLQASSVAATFLRLAHEAGSEESAGHKALMEAGLYVLRLSNMPGGYCDLMQAATEGELDEYSLQRNAWTTVELGIRTALAAGALGPLRKEVETVVSRTQKLIDAWTDGTPMAARLLATLERYRHGAKTALVLVLPNQRYIRLAHRYLGRKLGDAWSGIEGHIEWHTLSTIGRNLSATALPQTFVFVGANRDVLRILLVHPHIPNGTTVLIAYRQAQSLLTTLRGMKELEALKPYRGRIGLFVQQLESRLGEVPNPVQIERLGDMAMTFKFDEAAGTDPGSDQNYTRFELEGGRRAYSAGWVYRYEPDEDPFFRRTQVRNVAAGDMLFDMTDELRGKVEAALHLDNGTLGSVVHPERAFLKLYHQDVLRRSKALFQTASRSALATAIHARMLELDASTRDCSVGRVNYWLSLTEGDTKPHASKDGKFFVLFCRALDLSEADALTYWNFIKNARRLNQNLGRALAAQYAEILFQPESAVAYRKIPLDVVKQLQQDALGCVFRVEGVTPPAAGLDL